MKKTISLTLTLLFVLLIAGCSSGNSNSSSNGNSSKNDPKKLQFSEGQKAYQSLTEASDICVEIMNVVYNAWYFSIYEADDIYSEYKMYTEFANRTGLDYSDVVSTMDSIYYSKLEDFNFSVAVAQQILIDDGKYEEATNYIEDAKESLKNMTNEYEDYTNYSNLKKYYSEVSSYLEFAQSPSGSFAQLKETIDNYETNIRTYKNDLGFIFEE